MARCGLKRGWVTSLLLQVFLVMFLNRNVANAAANGADWNYNEGDIKGAENWHINYRDCGGVMQSPINIETSKVIYDQNLEEFDLSDYSETEHVHMKLENVHGHTAEVILSGRELYLKGGSLPADYKLEQFHFHWGINESRGSEHSLNGKFSPLEVHFVHKQRRFDNVSVAAAHPFGLAVVGFLFSIGQHNNHFDPLLSHLRQIPNPDDEVDIQTFRIRDLLPSSIHYYRYFGSLTTPPCYESVIWSIACEKIVISAAQLAEFRELYDENHHHLVNDYRPIQSLNRRTVTTNNKIHAPSGHGDRPTSG